MKKFLLSSLLMGMSFLLTAQDIDKASAMQLVIKNSSSIGLSAEDLQNCSVISAYNNKYAGTQMVYLQQTYLGLPVFNQIQSLAFKNGKLVSAAGERVKGMAKLSGTLQVAPAVTPENAVKTALTEKKVPVTGNFAATMVEGNPTKLDFGDLGVALQNITAELMWVPLQDGKEIKLAWQVYLVPKNSSDYFLIRIDAIQNKYIDESNLTVYCNFEAGDKSHAHQVDCTEQKTNIEIPFQQQSPTLVGTANYLVVPYPAESPNHPGGTPALRTNPWLMAPGNATTLGWHNDGITDYTATRGNNVYAQEDRDNSNTTFGAMAVSTTSPDPLNFNFVPNFTVTPIQTTPVQNQQFNITNLFYWNNIIHDLTYLYGFDEVAGNFQSDNMGRGGAVTPDYVIADAQDAGGTNNANFSTPVDGLRPRMQMYLWSGSPQKDGDVDNGIVVHEYGHGISNRLTGGPTTTSCLGNAEQMGEGWSDYYGLMYTQDWSTSTLTTGFSSPRGIGTYALNQAITGLGIRSQRYCTNFAVNNKVYAATIPASSHDRGEIWCATLWDMTWNIINQVGVINPNLFNPAGGGGNAIALKLVTEGMKLQPCSPGFITGRNAILQADMILYGGLYQCAIKEAFRRRGMGDNASQGSSGSVTDQVPDFAGGVSLLLTQNGMTQVQEGQNIVYTNTINSTCAAITGFTLTDTLPLNVTYVSGGTYNAATRVVSFPVTQAAGAVANYSFTVNVNAGSYFAPITVIDEQVTGTTIPATWTTTATPAANVWFVSSLASQSAPNSLFVENLDIAGDQKLESTSSFSLPAGTSPRLSFAHRFNTEAGWDGGVVEISINGGTSWIDLGPYMVTGGYNSGLGAAPTNVLSGRSAFSGTITSFMTTTINLSAFAGQTNVKLRFRFGSDDNTGAPSGIGGWFVDNILLNISPVVNMRSSLFNATNVRVSVSDTITVIVQGVICSNATIVTQPSNVSACIGNTATFTVAATGTNIVYQWQSSPDGVTWTNIPGATGTSYTTPAVTAGMNDFRYRVIVSNACPSSVTSTGAILTVSSSASITSQPANTAVCPGANATFNVTASGSSLTYQWQVSTNNGVTYTNVPGGTTSTLNVPNVTPAMNGYLYTVTVFSCGPVGVTSNPATLSTIAPLSISSQPANTSACVGNTATFSVTAAGPGLTYQWQVSTNNGVTFTNITGATTSTLTLNGVSLVQNGNQYRVVLSGSCAGLTSNAATLSINTPVSITNHPSNVEGCSSSAVTFTVTALGTSVTYQWQVSMNGGPWSDLTNTPPYSGVNTNTLTVSDINASMAGYQYRVVVSGVPCGQVISDPGSLTVNQRPGVVLVASEYSNITPGVPTTLYTTVSPGGRTYTYQWFRDGQLVPNVTTSSYMMSVDRLGQYQVIVTDSLGCSTSSNFVRVADSVTNVIFIHPNPSNGQFSVRFYSPVNQTRERILTIYDAKGAMVYQKLYTNTRPYDLMEVNMRSQAAGIYMLKLSDKNGQRLGSSRVLIQ